MDEEIIIKYAVIDEAVADIQRLADKTQQYAQLKKGKSRSKGASATNTDQSLKLVADYASALAGVMYGAARSISDAKNAMMEADENLAQSMATSQGPTAGGARAGHQRH